MLAELGYVALAIDMFGGGRVAETPDEAASLMNGVLDDMETGTAALKAGYQLLQNQVGVDAERTAAIGYCFGGAMVLHMARIGLPLSAVASFHGALGSFHQAEPGSIKPTILVCHGAADSMVSMADLESFKQEMTQAKADFEVLLLADARHGFSNPQASVNAEKYGLDLGYQQQADAKSWAAMQALFDRVF
jgi:dienelactone hydrolase